MKLPYFVQYDMWLLTNEELYYKGIMHIVAKMQYSQRQQSYVILLN